MWGTAGHSVERCPPFGKALRQGKMSRNRDGVATRGESRACNSEGRPDPGGFKVEASFLETPPVKSRLAPTAPYSSHMA